MSPDQTCPWPARYRRLRAVHGLALVVAAAAIYLGLGWPQIVRENWQLRGVFLLDTILILLPVLLLLALSWWALGTAEQAFEDRSAARQGRTARRLSGWGQTLSLVRHVIAPALVPLLLVLGAQDVAARFAPSGTAAWLLTGAIGASAILGYPWLLRWMWQTEPLADGTLLDRLREVEQRLDVRTGEILVWKTGGVICNAAVAGILPYGRIVLLSDALLSRLQPSEIAAIYAHELGHVKHRHLLQRLLVILLPVLGWQALAVSFPGTWQTLCALPAEYGLPPALPSALLTLLAAGLYGAGVFSWYCRALEREADLCACGGTADYDAEPFVIALATLSALTQSRRQAAKATWLHPAITDRIAFVREMAVSPEERNRFMRRMRRLARLLLAMVAGLAVWPLAVAVLGRL